MKIEHHLRNFYLPVGSAEQSVRDAKGTETAQAVDRDGQSADKRRKREQEQNTSKSKLRVERVVEGEEEHQVPVNEAVSKPGLNIIV